MLYCYPAASPPNTMLNIEEIAEYSTVSTLYGGGDEVRLVKWYLHLQQSAKSANLSQDFCPQHCRFTSGLVMKLLSWGVVEASSLSYLLWGKRIQISFLLAQNPLHELFSMTCSQGCALRKILGNPSGTQRCRLRCPEVTLGSLNKTIRHSRHARVIFLCVNWITSS